MNRIAFNGWILLLLLVSLGFADEAKHDVRKGIPTSAYLAVYGQRNPERDAQREYVKKIGQSVRDDKIVERALAIVLDQLPAEQKQSVASISDELTAIFDAVDWQVVADSPEVAYGQVMEMPQTQHILLLRLASVDAAISCETALGKLMEMVEQRSSGAAHATVEEIGAVKLHALDFPKIKEFPLRPGFARVDDVLVISTSSSTAREHRLAARRRRVEI